MPDTYYVRSDYLRANSPTYFGKGRCRELVRKRYMAEGMGKNKMNESKCVDRLFL